MASWTVGRVKGIRVRLHWTLLLVLPFFAYLMAREYFPGDGTDLAGLAWGAALAVTLFLSVLLHEFSHSFMALRLGSKVDSILLMPIGGVSQMESAPESPRGEFLMTVVGPLTNFAIAAPLLAIHSLGLVPAGQESLAAFVRWSAWLNVALGAFNLFLPAFPMDGGRLLRAALSVRMGPLRATRVAATVGRTLAFAMGLVGLLSFGVGGVWLILIAFFIYLGAGAEERAMTVRSLLEGLTARDLMTPDPVRLAPGDPLESVRQTMLETRHLAFPVVDGDRLVGCLGLEELSAAQRAGLPSGSVRDAMHTDVPRVAAGDSADEVLHAVQKSHHGHAFVLQDERLLGIVSGTDLERFVRVLAAVRGAEAEGPRAGQAVEGS